VTKRLLAQNLNLAQAADWLIEQNALPRSDREGYRKAMGMRFSRQRQVSPTAGASVIWKASVQFNACHAVPAGTSVALCGAKDSLWLNATSTSHKCDRCRGVATRGGVIVTE
jgi:hypothetical protein